MATKTSILKLALRECEQGEITDPSDLGDPAVKKVSDRYPEAVLLLFEAHPWNFAQRWEKLQKKTNPGQIGRRLFGYNKPGSCKRIVLVNPSGSKLDNARTDHYEDQEGLILTDLDPCYLLYISSDWLTREGSWPQSFADAVGYEIAASSYAGTGGRAVEKKKYLREQATEALTTARDIDSDNGADQSNPRGSWAAARTRGSRTGRGC